MVRSGLNTASMNYDEKEALFETYFSFIKNDFEILAEKNPDDEFVAESAEWLESHYSDMADAFLEDGFFFSLGFMLFTAKR